MRILADSNIVAQAVRAMRGAGHVVVHVGERTVDPGDEALLTEATADGRIFVMKDHDIGALIHRDRYSHCGLLLLNDRGDAATETGLILSALAAHRDRQDGGAVFRMSARNRSRCGGRARSQFYGAALSGRCMFFVTEGVIQ